jgi:hypothetical protein
METILAVAPTVILISFAIAIPSTIYWSYRIGQRVRSWVKNDGLVYSYTEIKKVFDKEGKDGE